MITGSFYTIGEAATRLKKHRNTVSRWIKQGQLPAFQLGNVVLIEKEDVDHIEAEVLETNLGKDLNAAMDDPNNL